MKILVTGTAGRVGRAIYIHLMKEHEVVGIDRTPCSTADVVGDIRDTALLAEALEGVEVIIHTAALHAPHVGLVPGDEFWVPRLKPRWLISTNGCTCSIGACSIGLVSPLAWLS